MKDSNLKLTASQFAKLHNLNKRTLHFYDSIHLFSPRCKGENNYRYYDYSQSMELEYILMLKELNMSLEEIKAYLTNPNPDSFGRLAEEKLAEIDREIQKLKGTKRILQRKKEQLSLCRRVQNFEIQVLECREEYLLTTSFSFSDDDAEQAFSHLKQTWDRELYRTGFGSYISVEKVLSGAFEEYDGLFVPLQKKRRDPACILRPAGQYLCGYLIGSWDRLPELYSKILEFSRSCRLRLSGYAYETGLNEFAISGMEEYVTQVLVHAVPEASKK